MRLKSCGSSNSYGEVISPMCYYLAAFRPRLQSTFSMKTEYSVWLFNVFEYVWTSSGKWKYRKLKSFTVLETFWWVQNFVCSVYYYDRDRSCMTHCSKLSNYVQKFNFEKMNQIGNFIYRAKNTWIIAIRIWIFPPKISKFNNFQFLLTLYLLKITIFGAKIQIQINLAFKNFQNSLLF